MLSEYLLKKQGIMTGTIEPDPQKKKKGIAKRSKKRNKEQRKYVKIVKEKIATDAFCEIRAEGCEGQATGLHYLVKRSPKTFLNRDLLIRACNNCNGWVEKFPAAAKKKGVLLSKFQKQ